MVNSSLRERYVTAQWEAWQRAGARMLPDGSVLVPRPVSLAGPMVAYLDRIARSNWANAKSALWDAMNTASFAARVGSTVIPRSAVLDYRSTVIQQNFGDGGGGLVDGFDQGTLGVAESLQPDDHDWKSSPLYLQSVAARNAKEAKINATDVLPAEIIGGAILGGAALSAYSGAGAAAGSTGSTASSATTAANEAGAGGFSLAQSGNAGLTVAQGAEAAGSAGAATAAQAASVHSLAGEAANWAGGQAANIALGVAAKAVMPKASTQPTAAPVAAQTSVPAATATAAPAIPVPAGAAPWAAQIETFIGDTFRSLFTALGIS